MDTTLKDVDEVLKALDAKDVRAKYFKALGWNVLVVLRGGQEFSCTRPLLSEAVSDMVVELKRATSGKMAV